MDISKKAHLSRVDPIAKSKLSMLNLTTNIQKLNHMFS